MNDLKEQVIKFSKKLNSTNLSPLRSGNVSVRATKDGIEGFLITFQNYSKQMTKLKKK